MTSKKSEIIKSNYTDLGIFDPYFIYERFQNPFHTPYLRNPNTPASDSVKLDKLQNKRLIKHPLFKNITYKQTELELKGSFFKK